MKQSIPDAVAQVVRIRGFAWTDECAPEYVSGGVPVLADDGSEVGTLHVVEVSLDAFELRDAIAPLDSSERSRLLTRQWAVEREIIETFERGATRDDALHVLRRAGIEDGTEDNYQEAAIEGTPELTSRIAASRHAQALLARAIAEFVQDSASDAPVADLAQELASIREVLFVDSIRLAAGIASAHRGRLPPERAFSDASVGLLEALDRFEPARGYQFSTYATWWIRHRVTRARSDHSKAIRLPVHAEETLFKFIKAERELERELGTRVSTDFVLDRARQSSSVLAKISEWRRPVLRLATMSDEPHRLVADLLLDPMLPSPADGGLRDGWVERFEARMFEWIAEASRKGETREGVVALRLALGRADSETLNSIGLSRGVSRERIRQLESEVLDGIARLWAVKHGAGTRELWDWYSPHE